MDKPLIAITWRMQRVYWREYIYVRSLPIHELSSNLPFQLSWKLEGSCVLLISPVDSWSTRVFVQVPPGDAGSETRPPIPQGSWRQTSAINIHKDVSTCKSPCKITIHCTTSLQKNPSIRHNRNSNIYSTFHYVFSKCGFRPLTSHLYGVAQKVTM